MSARCVKMLYVRVCASETTVTFVGHCNPLRLSLSAFLYLYSKCQCINAFSEGVWGLYCHGEEESMGKKEQRRTAQRRESVCVPWESRVSSMAAAGGIYREK